MINVLVNGALGKMGSTVVGAVMADKDLNLVAAVDILEKNDAGEKLGIKTNIPITTNLDATIKNTKPDVIIDFTQPKVVFENAKIAILNKVPIVIGTTGLIDDEKCALDNLAKENNTKVFIAANFAIGAVLLMHMATIAAKYMPHCEIIEMHHNNKLDAPSGTSLVTAKKIAKVRTEMVQGAKGEEELLAGARGADFEGMKIHSVRLPGYVAHEEVIFGSLGQTLTIRHDSIDRSSFMPGVVLAAKKIMNLQNGLTENLDTLLDLK